jgi:hypothetical protein
MAIKNESRIRYFSFSINDCIAGTPLIERGS